MGIVNNIKKKRGILYLLMVVVTYLAWAGSFEKTISALVLNRQLKNIQQAEAEPDAGFRQLERKHTFYQQVLKGYQVRKQDRENRLWQSISGLAIYSEVKIYFDKEAVVTSTDTLSTIKGNVADRFRFKGNYKQVLVLLDTMEKSKGIGKLSILNIVKPKVENGISESNELDVDLKLTGILH